MTKSIRKPASGWKIDRITTHPGSILHHDFLLPLGLSANRLAMETHMPATRIGEILRERRGITPDTALRLAAYFGTSAEFWLNLQQSHDLTKSRLALGKRIKREVQPLVLEAVSA